MAKALAQKRESLSQVAYDQIKTMILQKELIPWTVYQRVPASRDAVPGPHTGA